MTAAVEAVASHSNHDFSKTTRPEVRLLAGLGVEGDAHAGVTVEHRSRVLVDPSRPNLRQVHLIPAELLDELAAKGFAVAPAELGENVTTRGLDLQALPRGARIRLGPEAVIEITGLRNPCPQIESFRPGLLAQLRETSASGEILRRAGVMAVVLEGGLVRPGDVLTVELPEEPHEALAPV